MKKGALCRMRELPGSGSWLRAGVRDFRFRRRDSSSRRTVLQCDQTTTWATLRIRCSEEVGQSLQGRVRFVLRVRLQHGNNLDCPTGAFSARRRGLGIFAVAALTRLSNKHAFSSVHISSRPRREADWRAFGLLKHLLAMRARCQVT